MPFGASVAIDRTPTAEARPFAIRMRTQSLRNCRQDRRNEIGTFRDADHVVGEAGDLFSAFGGDGDHTSLASFDLLEGIDVFFVDRVIWSNHNRRDIRSNERDNPVL